MVSVGLRGSNMVSMGLCAWSPWVSVGGLHRPSRVVSVCGIHGSLWVVSAGGLHRPSRVVSVGGLCRSLWMVSAGGLTGGSVAGGKAID